MQDTETGDEGMRYLSDALKVNNTLQILDLSRKNYRDILVDLYSNRE